ncbi:uncharacterized protein CDAR_197221 [Caerostris darwini]|uniref:BPTI/Kunitz inhibitor domain-containing protein n=1 Tax=Caerostris darwini TaxID=1538125 RepID=A0AAV4M8B8_9ARAC|nr:uncharacterized protein CDAR_197221 [Caerostris darwini]
MEEMDLYIPAICDIEAFDLNPGYGILLSQQPMTIIECYSTGTQITCSKWTAIENTHYHVPCKAENVVLIEVLETSAGPIVAPDLEIMEYLNDKNQPYIVLNVETTTDEPYGIFDRVDYIDGTKGCKYAKVKVLKDLSPESMTMEGNLFTIIASADCNNGLFKMVNGIALLMSDKPILPGTAVYLEEDSTEVVGIHPGTTHISLCSSHSAVFMPKEVVTSPDHVSSKNYDPLPDKSAIVDEYPPSDIKPRMTEEKPADPIKKKPVQSETSCQGHIDDSCPVCEDIYSISPEIYCNSQLSLLTRAIGLHYDNQTCSYGTLASLYDATASKAPELSVLKISYTIPAHCSCSALKENSYLLIMMEESMPMMNPLPLKFSKGMHLYTATEGRTSLPTCVFQDALIARSGNISKIIELDSPNKELREMMPELSLLECPNMDRTCPKCGSVNEEELKSLYCESEEVLLVSRNKKSKNDTRKFPSTGKITFAQFMNDENYTLDINIDRLESICTLPKEEGNCSESDMHYYYDADFEMCTEFFYSGCGGNANNFAEMDQCQDACYRPDFCVEGSLNVKKIIRSPDNDDDYPNAKFLYSLPEHCECPDLLEGDGTAYLMSTSDVDRSNTQLTDSHYFIPLPKDQKKKKISCE